MSCKISTEDVIRLRAVLNRLREFRDEWSKREDDPEDMWIEAPEMAAMLVSEMEAVISRLDEQP
jgi:hypothetical protein